MASDARLGRLILLAVSAFFVYYFTWVAVLPFLLVNESNLIRAFFPPLQYAFVLATTFGVVFLGGVAVFTLYHMWRIRREEYLATPPKSD